MRPAIDQAASNAGRAQARPAGRIGERLRAHLPLKAGLSAALPLLFGAGYFTLQRLPLREPRRLPLTAVDRWIDFDPSWVWAYQSAYLLFPLFPWLATSREHLKRYTAGFLAASAAGFACFAFFPVECPRPEALPEHSMFRLLAAYDGKTNAFPSLHCALAAYAVLFGARAIGPDLPPPVRRGAITAAWLWVAAISYSTLATRQHYLVDVPAGFLLAWLGHRLAWRTVDSGARFRPPQEDQAERRLR